MEKIKVKVEDIIKLITDLNLKEIKRDSFIKVIRDLNLKEIKRDGFILLPSVNSFDVFKISEERLKLYLQAESLYIKANKPLCKECEEEVVREKGMVCDKCESYREQ